MPQQKCIERITADKALARAGVRTTDRCGYDLGWGVKVGREKLATRVKYSFVHPTEAQMSTLARSWAARNPGRKTSVYIGGPTYPHGWRGVCFKVFNQ